jgi:PAS domain S-box-containing protein
MIPLNEDFFRGIVAHMREGLWVADAGHRILYANQAMSDIAGIPTTSLIGANVLDLFPESGIQSFRDHYLGAVNTLQSRSWSCRIITQDGRSSWQGGWLLPRLEAGQLKHILCTARDISKAKQDEASLREKESLLRTVIDEIPDPIVLKDYKGDFLLGNQAVARLYNTTPEQMPGKHDDDFGVPKEMADMFRQTVLATMAKGETEVIYENSQDAVSGEIRNYRSIKKPFKDASGRNQILVIAQDISDVIRSQAKVAESERRLQEVLRVTQEGIWDWHLPTGRVLHNTQWYETIGAAEGDIPTTVEAFANLIHPDDKAAVMQKLDDLLQGRQEFYQSEHRLLGRNGPIWVQDRGGIAERDAHGNPIRVVGSYTDITMRREVEAKLANLLDEQQAILQSEVVGFVMLNGEEMSWMNTAYAQMLGYTTEELTRQPASLLYGSEADFRAFKLAANAVIDTGGVFRRQIQLPRKHAEPGWFDISGARLHAGNDASIWAFVDISSQKQTESALIEARQAAEQANLAKSQFLANMSHEIRTPMNGILGMAQLLLMPGLTHDERDDYAKTILTSGQTLLTLLNDILDISKVEAGKLTLAQSAIDPAQIIEDSAKLFAEMSQSKDLKVDAIWRGQAQATYLSDPIRLRQMLSNLVSNAIKFTPRGFIHIEASEVERTATHALLEFSVTDSGIGIPLDKQSLLFKAFSQVDSTNTRQYGGTGLGLSIVSSLSRLMGGEVGVASEAGKGARFWFRMQAGLIDPGQASTLVKAEAARKSIPQLGLTGCILVVEDTLTNRKVIEALLGKLGLQVVSVHDGKQALEALLQGLSPDLILMDCQMPVMDGFQATESIRAWEKTTGQTRQTIIALTAGAFEEDRQRCIAVGMDDFLAKPVNMHDLAEVIAKWLRP